jgi:tetratricopeptide (TPR) repeat protein
MGIDRLRPLWDFSDIDASERRLREALAAEVTDGGRAEVLTQLARIEGLRGRFEDGHRFLHEAELLGGDHDVVVARVLLERGRMLRLAGDLGTALPLFEKAYDLALCAGQNFIAADAAHMAALAGDMIAWTTRGLELAQRSSAAEPWYAMLPNNLGWWYLARHEYENALDAYQRSLEAHERESKRPYFREVARCGVAKALRGLGRSDEAAALVEQAVAWADSVGRPDRGFHEELAAVLRDLGKDDEADEQERRARLAGPGQYAIFHDRKPPPRSKPRT